MIPHQAKDHGEVIGEISGELRLREEKSLVFRKQRIRLLATSRKAGSCHVLVHHSCNPFPYCMSPGNLQECVHGHMCHNPWEASDGNCQMSEKETDKTEHQ